MRRAGRRRSADADASDRAASDPTPAEAPLDFSGLGVSGTGSGGLGAPAADPGLPLGDTNGLGTFDDDASGGCGRVGEPPCGHVEPGEVSVLGTMPREIVRRLLRRYSGSLRECYRDALAREPALGARDPRRVDHRHDR